MTSFNLEHRIVKLQNVRINYAMKYLPQNLNDNELWSMPHVLESFWNWMSSRNFVLSSICLVECNFPSSAAARCSPKFCKFISRPVANVAENRHIPTNKNVSMKKTSIIQNIPAISIKMVIVNKIGDLKIHKKGKKIKKSNFD